MLETIFTAFTGHAFGKSMSWVESKALDYRQNRQINKTVARYASKAKRFSCPEVAKRLFSNLVRLDECVEHCIRGDLPRHRIVESFLGVTPDDPEYKAAMKFGEDFVDELIGVIRKPSHRDARALDSSISEVGANISEIIVQADAVDNSIKSLEAKSDARHEELLRHLENSKEGTQLKERRKLESSYIGVLIHDLEAGCCNLLDCLERAANCDKNETPYACLEAYINLCMGRHSGSLNPLPGDIDNEVAFALVGAAIAARDFSFACHIAESAIPDSGGLLHLLGYLEKCINEPSCVTEPLKLSDKRWLTFAMLGNIELILARGHFRLWGEIMKDGLPSMNPLSRAHSQMVALRYDGFFDAASIDGKRIESYVKDAPSWSADSSLIESYVNQLDGVASLCDLSDLEASLEDSPAMFRRSAERVKTLRRIKSGTTDVDLRAIRDEAERNGDSELVFLATQALLRNSEGNRDEALSFLEMSGLLSKDVAFFSIYFKEIFEHANAEEFLRFEKFYPESPVYYLCGFEYFKGIEEGFARACMEKAIDLIKANSMIPTGSYSWVSYLIGEGRKSELLGLLKPAFPYFPTIVLCDFMQYARLEKLPEAIVDELVVSLKDSGRADTHSPEFLFALARYYDEAASQRDTPQGSLKAFEYAERSFAEMPSIEAACMIAYEAILIPQDVKPEVLSFLQQSDTSVADLWVARLKARDGETAESDAYIIKVLLRDDICLHDALGLYWTVHDNDNGPACERVALNHVVTLRLEGHSGAVEQVAFHETAIKPLDEGKRLFGIRHYSIKSNAFFIMRGKRVGDIVRFEKRNARIESIEPLASRICAEFFKNVEETPYAKMYKVDTDDPDVFVEQLTQMLKENEPPFSYVTGVPLGDGRVLHFGIESGNVLHRRHQVEFTVEVLFGQNCPFRRYPFGRCGQKSSDETYLLSLNAVIVLALSGLSGQALEGVLACSRIASTTYRRIKEDIGRWQEDIDKGVGHLSLENGKPAFCEYDEAGRDNLRDLGVTILDFLDQFTIVDPVAVEVQMEGVDALQSGERIDIDTARALGYTFVTEDLIEARLIDVNGVMKRCTVLQLLKECDCSVDDQWKLIEKFKEWKADIPLDFEE